MTFDKHFKQLQLNHFAKSHLSSASNLMLLPNSGEYIHLR